MLPSIFAKMQQRGPEEGRSDPCGYQGLLRRADARPQTRHSTVRNVLLSKVASSCSKDIFFSRNLKVAAFISISAFQATVHPICLGLQECHNASCVYLPLSRRSHSKVKHGGR